MPRSVLGLGGPAWQMRGYLGEEWRSLDLAAPPRPVSEWLPATVPGAVVADLHAAGEVPDPYADRNTLALQWVADRAWVYRRAFRHTLARGDRAFLRLDGLETPAHVYLDGVLLGDHDSPSLPAIFDVTEALGEEQLGGEALGGEEVGGEEVGGEELGGEAAANEAHVLAVVFDPSPHEQSQMGRTSLVHRHRGRMREGWDFCPRFPDAAISRPPVIETTGPARVESFAVRPRLDGGLRYATVDLDVRLDAPAAGAPGEVTIEWTLEGPDGWRTESRDRVGIGGATALSHRFTLESPELWWPNGMGMRPLYRASVTVSVATRGVEGDVVSDRQTLEFGLRQIELVPNTDAPSDALPYTLRVNGRRVYMRGWNWVPDDVMPGVPRPGHLERLLDLARASGANLLRVWGGGSIESEEFYRLCDRNGLLVWQEFLLSSSGQDNEPSGSPEYVALVCGEAERIVRSRLHHPSLAIWCGGNELSRGPDRLPLDERTSPVLLALRDVVRRIDPERVWLPTSPSGPTFMRDDARADRCDLHDVHGPWQYQGLGRQEAAVLRPAPLLHSDFGAPSLSDVRSIEATISEPDHGDPTKRSAVWRHRGAWWICDELVRDAFGGARADPAGDLPRLEWASQYLQAQALRGWIEANRRAWPRNSGSIPWQFDEPYPSGYGTCAVDWFGRPKAAYWAVRRAYAPLLISAVLGREAWAGDEGFEAEIWLTSDFAREIDCDVEAQVLDSSGCSIASLCQPLRTWLDRSAPVGRIGASLVGVRGVFALEIALRGHRGEPLAANRYLLSAERTLAPLADAQEEAGAVAATTVSLPSGRPAIAVVNRSRSIVPLARVDRLLEAAGSVVDATDLPDDCFSLLPREQRLLPLRRRDRDVRYLIASEPALRTRSAPLS